MDNIHDNEEQGLNDRHRLMGQSCPPRMIGEASIGARTFVPQDRAARSIVEAAGQTSATRCSSIFKLISTCVLVAFLVTGCGGPEPDTNITGPHQEFDRGPLQLSVTASADPISTTETLALTLKATLEDGYTVQFPAYPEADSEAEEADAAIEIDADTAFTPLDYEDAAPTLLDDGRVRRERRYALEPFLEGTYTIPPLEIRYGSEDESADTWLRMETDPIRIVVASVLAPDTEPALQSIVGPVDVQNPTPWGWYSFWLVVILGALGTFYYYRFVRVAPGPPPPPPIPPHKRALEALEAIQREKLVEKGLLKEYYIRVSDVLRRYMEDQYGFHAAERTTEEFLQELQQGALLGLSEQLLLKEFLRHCDLVKFAKTEPTSEQIQDTFSTCKQFVKETAAAQKKAAREALEGV